MAGSDHRHNNTCEVRQFSVRSLYACMVIVSISRSTGAVVETVGRTGVVSSLVSNLPRAGPPIGSARWLLPLSSGIPSCLIKKKCFCTKWFRKAHTMWLVNILMCKRTDLLKQFLSFFSALVIPYFVLIANSNTILGLIPVYKRLHDEWRHARTVSDFQSFLAEEVRALHRVRVNVWATAYCPRRLARDLDSAC